MGTMTYGALGLNAFPGISNTFQMDAGTDYIAFRYFARTADPIVKAEVWISNKFGTPHDLQCVLTANASGGIPNVSGGTPVDVGGGSPTLTALAASSITANARLTITFTNSFTPTAGQWYWLVLYPGTTGGNAYSASHRFVIRTTITGASANQGDDVALTSTDSGATFTIGTAGSPQVSWLTTGDAYLTTHVSCCLDDANQVDVDDTSNPDERGTAWDVPTGMTATVHGMSAVNRSESSTSDFDVCVYENDSQLASRSFDISEFWQTYGATATYFQMLFATSQSISAGTIGRVTRKATNATQYMRFGYLDFGSQARRESCLAWRHFWYCHRDGGSGSFTDVKSMAYEVFPVVEFAASGGGGSSPSSVGIG